MWSMLTTFQLITLDYWENVYNMVRTQYRVISCIADVSVAIDKLSLHGMQLQLRRTSLSLVLFKFA